MNYHNFVNTQSMTATEEYDGYYLVLDSKIHAAAFGMVKQLKEHQWSSKLTCDKDKAFKLYQAYLRIEYDRDNLPDNDIIMWKFDQLEQYIGIVFVGD